MILRLIVGALLTAMALGQLVSFAAMPDILSTYGVTGGAASTVLAVALIGAEATVGVWFLARPRSKAVVPVWMYTAVSVVWALLAVQAYARGLTVTNCGCFGTYLTQPLRWFVLVEDALMLLYAWLLLRGGRSRRRRTKAENHPMGFLSTLRALERATRPYDTEFAAAMEQRWAELPDVVRTPGQILGRHGVGCEGTHGVFPKCNLKCTPCYHSRDANQVRVDGRHTHEQVAAQMGLLRTLRGPRAHTQLIGGEVSLLPPDDHAATLEIMREHGREPMSFTHGDFDEEYLTALALGPDGKRRFDRLSFAAHFDKFMYGRRGIERPPSEQALNPYRKRFADMFAGLRREHGVRYFLAHNMTVTPGNLDEIADVVRDCRAMGYGMFSFQPAAFLGDERRWKEKYREATPDAVWAEIERGAGTPLDHHVFENGDVRCNRTAYGFYVGERWYPFLAGDDPRDLAVRDGFFRHFGKVSFTGTPPVLLATKLARVVARHPSTAVIALRWLARTAGRVGMPHLLRHRFRVCPVTFVMHQFMDAEVVAPAWEMMRRGEQAQEPKLRETQERLAACHYAMAHPENGTLVPACVQHAVLDPAENAQLRTLLPLVEVRTPVHRPATQET